MRSIVTLCCLLVFASIGTCAGISRAGEKIYSQSEIPGFNRNNLSACWLSCSAENTLLISICNNSRIPQSDHGTLFGYNPMTRELETLIAFNGSNGSVPTGVMAAGTDPAIMFGITNKGGKHERGTLFTIDLKSKQHEVIYDFASGGPSYPSHGLHTLNDHQLIGVCDTAGNEAPDEPMADFESHESVYVFDLLTKQATQITVLEQYGDVIGVPVVKDSNTIVMLTQNRADRYEHFIVEYSVAGDLITSATEVNMFLQVGSVLRKGKDSCYYVVNSYLETTEKTYVFLEYNSGTKKCSRVAKGSNYPTMYSAQFTTDNTGSLIGFFVMGPGMSEGLVYRIDPKTDKVEVLKQWDEKHSSESKNHDQLDPGYDWMSNIILLPDNKLYVMSSESGLISFDIRQRKVERLVRF